MGLSCSCSLSWTPSPTTSFVSSVVIEPLSWEQAGRLTLQKTPKLSHLHLPQQIRSVFALAQPVYSSHSVRSLWWLQDDWQHCRFLEQSSAGKLSLTHGYQTDLFETKVLFYPPEKRTKSCN